MAPNCSAVKCKLKRSDKSISFHTFPNDALRLAIWLKYCVPGFKNLNQIDLDANPEAAEHQDDLEIVNFNTQVKFTEQYYTRALYIHSIIYTKALYDSTEDPLDKDASNVKKLKKNKFMCIP
ncbi:hypothetical protein GHT06_020276 [Daphnia sinensis]|uniref:THAP-type domain-containing protein n=1 Tax=Daphnia sinensis TaxID=1820382 RepID=A0AAD5PQ39_9CRUS|nr:hypothetical protein GHT06_020276 [Daphnia sinensis]